MPDSKRSKGSSQSVSDRAWALDIREQALGLREAAVEQWAATVAQREARTTQKEHAILLLENADLRRQLVSEKVTEKDWGRFAAGLVKQEHAENLERENEATKCFICEDSDVEVVLVKCMHACLCSTCSEQLFALSNQWSKIPELQNKPIEELIGSLKDPDQKGLNKEANISEDIQANISEDIQAI